MKFAITKVEGTNTWVTFTFDDGSTSSQTIANLPVDDAEALAEALTAYADGYLAGKEIENAKIPLKKTSDFSGKAIAAVSAVVE